MTVQFHSFLYHINVKFLVYKSGLVLMTGAYAGFSTRGGEAPEVPRVQTDRGSGGADLSGVQASGALPLAGG